MTGDDLEPGGGAGFLAQEVEGVEPVRVDRRDVVGAVVAEDPVDRPKLLVPAPAGREAGRLEPLVIPLRFPAEDLERGRPGPLLHGRLPPRGHAEDRRAPAARLSRRA